VYDDARAADLMRRMTYLTPFWKKIRPHRPGRFALRVLESGELLESHRALTSIPDPQLVEVFDLVVIDTSGQRESVTLTEADQCGRVLDSACRCFCWHIAVLFPDCPRELRRVIALEMKVLVFDVVLFQWHRPLPDSEMMINISWQVRDRY
jgi:hypothetical protein